MKKDVVIVTGAAGGIGSAICTELARLGYALVLVGRTEATLRQAQGLVGQESLVIAADVTQPESSRIISEQTLSRFGRIDALVNNAGIAPVLSIEQTTAQAWRQIIDTNLSAAFYLSRAVWPVFKQQRAGVIVNISSMAARDPFDGFLAYGAAKAGLNTLGLSLAREGAGIGVRVHTIAPGAVETSMFRGILSPRQFSPDNTLDPADVARLVGQYVRGAELRHTSGEVIWMMKRA